MDNFPAGLDAMTVQCRGRQLLGALYRGAGVGPRPSAILVHGLPGVEKNLDVAYALRDAGWNCLYFHYRGSWGSEGTFTLEGCPDDLLAVTDWITEQPCVDSDRLALVGHSWGGYLALTAGAMDRRVKAIAVLCPFLSSLGVSYPLEMYAGIARMLVGVTPEDLKSKIEAVPGAETQAENLRDRPVLVVTGGQDDLPPSQCLALKTAVPTVEWHDFPEADHSLSLCRPAAVAYCVAWLIKQLGK